MSDAWSLIFAATEFGFNAFFTLEAILKCLAGGFLRYIAQVFCAGMTNRLKMAAAGLYGCVESRLRVETIMRIEN